MYWLMVNFICYCTASPAGIPPGFLQRREIYIDFRYNLKNV